MELYSFFFTLDYTVKVQHPDAQYTETFVIRTYLRPDIEWVWISNGWLLNGTNSCLDAKLYRF
jgi:hypothetical protein